jgi:hypothetical protein
MKTMENKTHYRKVFKSDHLGTADLEEFLEEKKRLVFTIKEVKQEYDVIVAGRKGNHNIAYFKENIKPLVLNATNSRIVRSFNENSPFVEDWNNTIIELYIDANVKMKGEIVGGVRIKPTQPKATKPEITKDSGKWKDAIDYYKKNKSFDGILKHYILSDANQKLIKDEAKIS